MAFHQDTVSLDHTSHAILWTFDASVIVIIIRALSYPLFRQLHTAELLLKKFKQIWCFLACL